MNIGDDTMLSTLTAKIAKIDKDSRAYQVITTVFFVLDILAGILCIIFSSIQITAIVTSVLSGATVCSRIVQLFKSRKFMQTISLLNSISASYIVFRVKKGEYMKKWIKANKWTVIVSIFACGFVGATSWFLISAFWIGVPLWAHVLIVAGASLLTIVPVYLLGAETIVQWTLRLSSKGLPAEKVDELTNVANQFKEEVAKAKVEEELKKREESEVAKAKRIVDEYENAKKILEDKRSQ